MPLGLPKGEFLALNLALRGRVHAPAPAGVMMRFGLFAAVAGLFTHTLLQSAPLGMGMGSWQGSRTVLVLLIVLGVGVFGFSRSLGREGAIREVLAEE